jgi:uncharacterized protein
MKALVIADRPPQGSIRDVIARESVALLITLGDLTQSDLAELEYITDIPKIGVYGNHCMGTYMEPLGIINMHRRIWKFGGLTFGGFEGCVRYKENPEAIMYTQDEATAMMKNFPKVDVFLSHAPPSGINDEPDNLSHQGFHALRQYLEVNQPRVWLHGHTYPRPDQLITQYHATRVEYVHGMRVVEL